MLVVGVEHGLPPGANYKGGANGSTGCGGLLVIKIGSLSGSGTLQSVGANGGSSGGDGGRRRRIWWRFNHCFV